MVKIHKLVKEKFRSYLFCSETIVSMKYIMTYYSAVNHKFINIDPNTRS